MHKAILLLLASVCLTGCNSSSAPTAKTGDAVQQKLQELAGKDATNCGRISSQAQTDQQQLTAASACAMQAAQKKQPFYVGYDLPGMTIAVAGNSDGKLYSVQSQPSEGAQGSAAAELKSLPCPAELRIAQSGRVTCFSAGSFTNSMGASPHGGMGMGSDMQHGSMSMPPAGTPNPHSGGMSMPPAGTQNPHAGTAPSAQPKP